MLRRFRTLLAAGALLVPLVVAVPAAATAAGPRAADQRDAFSPTSLPTARGVLPVRLGTLGGAESVPTAVNDRGQVVGRSQTASGAWHAFLWDRGRMIDLAPRYADSVALDITSTGLVLLQRARTVGGPAESLLWSRHRTWSLGIVDAREVNEGGQVAGTVFIENPPDGSVDPYRTVFRWQRGVRADLGVIPGWEGRSTRFVDLAETGTVLGIGLSPESFELGFVWNPGTAPVPVGGDPFVFGGNGVVDLANTGQVAGGSFLEGAFVWTSGPVTPIGAPPGRINVAPVALDDTGRVAGTSEAEDGGPLRAFLWQAGTFTDIGPTDGTGTSATALNEGGQVLGQLLPASGAAWAFVWTDGRLVELRARHAASTQGVAISDTGFVTGTVTGADGHPRAALWWVGPARS